MPQWVWDVLALVRPHAGLIGLVLTWLGIAWVWLRRRRDWQRKSFMQQVNFSLNYVENGVLQLRTLMESASIDIWLNPFGVGLVEAAARRTSVEQPFLELGSRGDADYVRLALINALSERFAPVHLAHSLGLPTTKDAYAFGLTCEKYGGIKTQKLRIIIMRELDLRALFATPEASAQIRFNAPTHADRLVTLRKLHERIAAPSASESAATGRVELGWIR